MSGSYHKKNKGSRRGEPAPAPEYNPHLLPPGYSQDEQFSAQQPDPYSTGHYYDGYSDQDIEHRFSELSVGGQHPEGNHYTHEQDPAHTGHGSTYEEYPYPAGPSADAGNYSYEDGPYEQDLSAQPEMSEGPGQGFDSVVEQAQAGAYTGGAYPGYEEQGPSEPSIGAYGSPDAPLGESFGSQLKGPPMTVTDPVPEYGVFPAQSRDGSQEEIDMSQFVVEWSSAFSPGTVFKVMWSEPLGQTSRTTQKVEVNPQFYAGIRRFIVVTSGDGNSSCVPILTYERRACTKPGVNSKTHGIVHGAGPAPRPLKREPELGFAPVAMDLISGEKLAPESRVNYAKLQTIEHNVKVHIIGRVTGEDLDTVRYAVDACWQMRAHQVPRRNAPRRHKTRK